MKTLYKEKGHIQQKIQMFIFKAGSSQKNSCTRLLHVYTSCKMFWLMKTRLLFILFVLKPYQAKSLFFLLVTQVVPSQTYPLFFLCNTKLDLPTILLLHQARLTLCSSDSIPRQCSFYSLYT